MQLFIQPRRIRITATGQRSDNDTIGRLQFVEHSSRRMPKTAHYPVPIHGTTNGFRDDEPHPRPHVGGAATSIRVHNNVGLRGSYPVPHGVTELRRPPHPVLSREHWSLTRGSGSQ